MNSIINTYLDDVDKREKAATIGPWKYSIVTAPGWTDYAMISGYQRSAQYRDYIRRFDAEFIAHSRTDNKILLEMLVDCLEFISKKQIEKKETEPLVERLIGRIQRAKA